MLVAVRIALVAPNLSILAGGYYVFGADLRGIMRGTQSRRPTFLGVSAVFICLASILMTVYALPAFYKKGLLSLALDA